MNKKDDIVLTTIELYHKYDGAVSLDNVAEAVGCSKTLIIHYYDNRANLLSKCFELICHEIRLALMAVEFPEDHSHKAMRQYLMDVWRAYFDYLKKNPAKARFFIQYGHRTEPLPPKYSTPELVISKILGDRYGYLTKEDPELYFDIKYMIAIANGMAALVFSDKTDATEELTDKCLNNLMNGLLPDGK